jgi:phosphoglycerol transferase MdoB-like AlkP superfamily enzyme
MHGHRKPAVLIRPLAENTVTIGAVDQPDHAYSIAIDLIRIIGTLVTFLAFFAGLRFSRRSWPSPFPRVFKAVVAATSVAAVLLGVLCCGLLMSSSRDGLLADYYGLGTALVFALVCMLAALSAIFYLAVIRG